MKNSTFKSGTIMLFSLMLIVSTAFSQDWSGWRGTNHDGKVAGVKLPDQWPDQLKQGWQVNVGLGDATPALVGDKLYVHGKIGTDDVLQCLDAATGKELWRDANPSPSIPRPAQDHNGPRSTPAVDEGKIVSMGPDGIISCLDAKTGKVIWKNMNYNKEFPQFYVGTSPIIYKGNVYVQFGGKDKGSVVAFNLKTGAETWKWEGDAPTYSTPVILTLGKEKILVVQAFKNLLGLDLKTGKQLWQYATPPERMFYNSATPVIDGQNIILTGQGLGSKSLKVEKQGDKYTLTENWTYKDKGTSFNTVVLKDGFLYGNDARMGSLFCLNAKTGEKCWADTTRLDRFASIVDAGKVLFSLPSTKQLIVFKPNSKEFEPVTRYKVSDTPALSHPLITSEGIYIKEKEMLTFWKFK